MGQQGGKFADFEVWVDIPEDRTVTNDSAYQVRVVRSPEGHATGSMPVGFFENELLGEIAHVQSDKTDSEARLAFGQKLFDALFDGHIRDAWNISTGRVEEGEASALRLRLSITAPELTHLPWELLYHDGRGFIATSSSHSLSRYLPVPEPPKADVSGKLRLLMIVESPSDLASVEGEETEQLVETLNAMTDVLEPTIRFNLSLAGIQKALQENNYHIVHFLGHGRKGKLMLVNETGTGAEVDDIAFSQLFQGRKSVRLVVLNACSSSQGADGRIFSGVGPALVWRSIPAVIAMQYPAVFLDTASLFSEQFYRALASERPVDLAVNEARQLLSADRPGARDWSTPVLYMGTRSGQILTMSSQKPTAIVPSRHLRALTQIRTRSSRLLEWLEFGRYVTTARNSFEFFKREVDRAAASADEDGLDGLAFSWKQCRESIIELETLAGGFSSISKRDDEFEYSAEEWIRRLAAIKLEIQAQINEKSTEYLGEHATRMGNWLDVIDSECRHVIWRELEDLERLSGRLIASSS